MRLNAAVTLGGGAMAASYFLPWLAGGLLGGAAVVPHEVLTPLAQELGAETPVELWAFLATFALAVIVAVLALVNASSRVLVLAAGAAPFAWLGWMFLRARNGAEATGLPLPTPDWNDFSAIWEMLQEVAQFGLWAYLGGALLLVVLAIADPG